MTGRYRYEDLRRHMKMCFGTIQRHLKQLGYVSRFDVWGSHKLTEANLVNRILICNSLLNRHKTNPLSIG
ncbi:unnamed protein product [Nezara viridula]|uniref:Uncharacterized protein n=1 Tax=Nezara viridula TaxID=85310 RepID=A0A9P0E6Y5_NEZVI|nr:unnamed protein product [Nezara viridula]